MERDKGLKEEEEFLDALSKLSLVIDDVGKNKFQLNYDTTTSKIIGVLKSGGIYIRYPDKLFDSLDKVVREKYKGVKGSVGIKKYISGIIVKSSINYYQAIQREKDNGNVSLTSSFSFDSDQLNIKDVEAMVLGERIHNYIERDLIKRYKCYSPLSIGSPKNYPEQIQKFVDRVIKDNGYTPQTCEYPVLLTIAPVYEVEVSELNGKQNVVMKKGIPSILVKWLIGKLDLLVKDKNNKLVLIDFKTSKAGDVTYKDVMQLRLLTLCLSCLGISVDRMELIVLDTSEKETKIKVNYFSVKMEKSSLKGFIQHSVPNDVNFEKYWEVFDQKLSYIETK